MHENEEQLKEQMCIPRVVFYTKRSLASLYRDIKKGLLAKPFRFGNRVYWNINDIDKYMNLKK